MSSLVRSGQPGEDGLSGLRSRVAELETLLGDRAAEFARVSSAVAAFKIQYRQQVGLLHEELDELENAIVEAELGELSRRLEGHTPDSSRVPADAQSESPSRYTSDAVRRLFRDVAKAIHPDLATDELTRGHRHTLMIEANRAYALGDEERLRWILQSWERSPEAVHGSGPEATGLRLERRIAQIEERLAMLATDLDRLKESPMWQLKTMVDDAAAKGKDLVRDMVARLRADIVGARNRLNAMQWTP